MAAIPDRHLLPTSAIDWLADYLCDPRRQKTLSLLMVTHDRYVRWGVCGGGGGRWQPPPTVDPPPGTSVR